MNTSITYTCTVTGCDQRFTNVEQLDVHLSNHELLLRFDNNNLTPQPDFLIDQTPTPTRFIKSCDEVGLFADLQNVNPFDETFKTATEHNTTTISEITNINPVISYTQNHQVQPSQAIYVEVIQKLPNTQPLIEESKREQKQKSQKLDANKRKEDILIRNRAAVHRSRIRKKKRQQALEAEFIKTVEINKQLTEQNIAYREMLRKYMHLFTDEDQKILDNLN